MGRGKAWLEHSAVSQSLGGSRGVLRVPEMGVGEDGSGEPGALGRS